MNLKSLCCAADVHSKAQAHYHHQCKLKRTFHQTHTHISNSLTHQKHHCQNYVCLCASKSHEKPVSVCQHVWMLPVEMCTISGCSKNSSQSAKLVFTLQSSTAVTLEEDEVIFFYCSTRAYEVMSGPLTCHCCFPCSLLPLFIPHPPNPFGCWGHPERMPCFGTTNDWGRKGDSGEEGK